MSGRPRQSWRLLAGGGVVLAVAAWVRAQADPWVFGLLLLVGWGLLAYGFRSLPVPKALRALLIATTLALAVIVWTYTTPQPRVAIDAVQLRTFPSSIQPGSVELVVRNNGTLAGQVVVFPVAYLVPFFGDVQQMAASQMERRACTRAVSGRCGAR